MSASPARPAQRAEAAFISLRTAIVEAALLPGTKLPEDVLAAQYDVSRTLIRAILARLVTAGLVESGKAKSATVASPSAAEAREVFVVRRCLEREAVRLAAAGWSRDAAAELRRHVNAEREAMALGDHRVSGRLAAEFHLRLGEYSGNSLMERYLAEVVWRCALILSVYGHPHDQNQSIAEHEELINLLESGDADGAEQLVLRHVSAVESRALVRGPETRPQDLAVILSRY
ncbi:hypothetical protein CcI49_27430 [Frankia sp. CcI49]|uniref:GntR family transcriptional regulator n=1 Tax=unclassified Frankia TaxID=2632575 RepID=UPI0006DA5F7C|nr:MULTISPECIES: GntR family transcriptional regulator [unclassified Frankia]KPM55040.1 hypothetical protein ACG83_17020 [Frankia sp. R43]ONH56196.1 hypothetical protein CcI49_27430 [Frankia sp. CcI49]